MRKGTKTHERLAAKELLPMKLRSMPPIPRSSWYTVGRSQILKMIP